jgi:hypothetical protein
MKEQAVHFVDWRCASPFYVGKLFGDPAISHLEYIHSTQVPWLCVFCLPVDPTYNTSLTHWYQLFGFKYGIRILLKETRPVRADSILSDKPRTIRGRIGVFEQAIVRHGGHDFVDIVTIESVVEPVYCSKSSSIGFQIPVSSDSDDIH